MVAIAHRMMVQLARLLLFPVVRQMRAHFIDSARFIARCGHLRILLWHGQAVVHEMAFLKVIRVVIVHDGRVILVHVDVEHDIVVAVCIRLFAVFTILTFWNRRRRHLFLNSLLRVLIHEIGSVDIVARLSILLRLRADLALGMLRLVELDRRLLRLLPRHSLVAVLARGHLCVNHMRADCVD